MRDPAVIAALARAPAGDRDRLLVLLACLLHDVSLHRIVRLTPARARTLLDARRDDPLVPRARQVLDAYIVAACLGDRDLLFRSRRMWPFDEPQPLGRIAAWRVVRRAVAAVLGPSVEGAWTVARAHGAP